MPRLDGRECETEGARWAWEPAGRHASTRRGASLRTLRGSTASAVDATPPTQLLPNTARPPHGPGGHEERRSSLASSVTDTGTRSDGAMPTLWSSMHWAGSWLHTRGGAGGVCSHGAVRWQQRGVRCSGRAAVQCRESEGVHASASHLRHSRHRGLASKASGSSPSFIESAYGCVLRVLDVPTCRLGFLVVLRGACTLPLPLLPAAVWNTCTRPYEERHCHASNIAHTRSIAWQPPA